MMICIRVWIWTAQRKTGWSATACARFVQHTNDEENGKARGNMATQVKPSNGTHDGAAGPLCPQHDEVNVGPPPSLPRFDRLPHALCSGKDAHAQGESPGDAGNVHVIDAWLVIFVVVGYQKTGHVVGGVDVRNE